METEASGVGYIGKDAVPVVAVQGGSVVGEICFENVQAPVAVVVRDGGAHAGLFPAIFVERDASHDGNVRKGSVAIIVVQNAGSAVASHINIGPSVVIEIDGGHAEGIVPASLIDMRGSRYVR